jgi:hypothetical protein
MRLRPPGEEGPKGGIIPNRREFTYCSAHLVKKVPREAIFHTKESSAYCSAHLVKKVPREA